MPVHQRLMLYVAHLGAPSTVFVCSRGTSKSAIIDGVYAYLRALLYAKRKGVTLSAAGFRGGQLLYSDIEAWLRGFWNDQEPNLKFFSRSATNDKIVQRAQNYWKIDTRAASSLMTVPTNDPTKIRGIRGNDLYLDEANFADYELVDKVALSFLNVLDDFKTGGDNAAQNCVFYTTTVDYAWRDFQRTATAAYDSMANDLEMYNAAREGNKERVKQLKRRGQLQGLYVTFDYSDLMIRRDVETRDGRVFTVNWPDKNRQFKFDPKGLPFTTRGSNGRLQKDGKPMWILSTYPINRSIEDKLLNGETVEEVWLAEQRNVVDTTSGDVYPHQVIDAVTCKGERELIPFEECGPEWQKKYDESRTGYAPTVMWSCSDPCVLGVDYAPGSRDFTAFVVIRIGPMAQGKFNPVNGLGNTEWSNVIWAEQHRNTSHADVANKIREFADRYNLVYFHDHGEHDTWQLCRAIGLDMRGGGSGVRDELVHINKTDLSHDEYRIYDPLDTDDRVLAFANDPKAKPMLDAIHPTDQLNDKLVEFTAGQMTQGLLYLPKFIPESERPYDPKLDIGFNGAKLLAHQLRVLQQKPTKNFRTFFVKGDTEDATNKKDLWAAFIYGAKQARAHIIRQRMINDTPPPMGGVITRIGGKNGGRLRLRGR